MNVNALLVLAVYMAEHALRALCFRRSIRVTLVQPLHPGSSGYSQSRMETLNFGRSVLSIKVTLDVHFKSEMRYAIIKRLIDKRGRCKTSCLLVGICCLLAGRLTMAFQ